jgi:cystathionine beta-synthase
MRQNDVSQLPVVEGQRVVGIVDESDLLTVLSSDESRFRAPVRQVMSTALVTVRPTLKVTEVLPILASGMVPIVVDGDEFLGLVTRMDVLNALRRRLR